MDLSKVCKFLLQDQTKSCASKVQLFKAVVKKSQASHDSGTAEDREKAAMVGS